MGGIGSTEIPREQTESRVVTYERCGVRTLVHTGFERTSDLERSTVEGDSPVFQSKSGVAKYPEYTASDIAVEHSAHCAETLNTSQNR